MLILGVILNIQALLFVSVSVRKLNESARSVLSSAT